MEGGDVTGAVGFILRDEEGKAEGDTLGLLDGGLLGEYEGWFVGDMTGGNVRVGGHVVGDNELGSFVGDNVVLIVGTEEGHIERTVCAVGKRVETIVGCSVGLLD